MFESSQFFYRELRAEFGILCFLQIGKEILLCHTALIDTILFGMHSQFKEFLIVLTALPTIVFHLLAESIKCIVKQCMWIDIGKFAFLLDSEFFQFGCDLSRNLSALAEYHAPHGIVHHHIASLALLYRQQVHQGNILGVL